MRKKKFLSIVLAVTMMFTGNVGISTLIQRAEFSDGSEIGYTEEMVDESESIDESEDTIDNTESIEENSEMKEQMQKQIHPITIQQMELNSKIHKEKDTLLKAGILLRILNLAQE